MNKDTSKAKGLQSITEDEDALILCVAPVTGNVKFLPSISNLGGTKARKANRVVALDGCGSQAQAVLTFELKLLSSFETDVPTPTSSKRLALMEKVRSVQPPKVNAKTNQTQQGNFLPSFSYQHIHAVTELGGQIITH